MRPRRCIALLSIKRANQLPWWGRRGKKGAKGEERGRGGASKGPSMAVELASDHDNNNDHYKVGRRGGGGSVEPYGSNGSLPEGLECVMIGHEIGTERKRKGFGT